MKFECSYKIGEDIQIDVSIYEGNGKMMIYNKDRFVTLPVTSDLLDVLGSMDRLVGYFNQTTDNFVGWE